MRQYFAVVEIEPGLDGKFEAEVDFNSVGGPVRLAVVVVPRFGVCGAEPVPVPVPEVLFDRLSGEGGMKPSASGLH